MRLPGGPPGGGGSCVYKRTLVRMIDSDKRCGLPCLNFLVRSDMVYASYVVVVVVDYNLGV